MNYTEDALIEAVAALGWDVVNDDIVVEIGGTSVSGIDVGEEYNKKWQSPIGTRKYNNCLLYTSPSPRDLSTSRMPSSA